MSGHAAVLCAVLAYKGRVFGPVDDQPVLLSLLLQRLSELAFGLGSCHRYASLPIFQVYQLLLSFLEQLLHGFDLPGVYTDLDLILGVLLHGLLHAVLHLANNL